MKRVVLGILVMLILSSSVGDVFASQINNSDIETMKFTDCSEDVQYKTGRLDIEVIELNSDVMLDSVYHYNDLLNVTTYSMIYNSEWDKYSTNYVYNCLTQSQKKIWDALDILCLSYLSSTVDATTKIINDITYNCTEMVYVGELSYQEALYLAYWFTYSNPQYYFLNTSVFTTTYNGEMYIGFGFYEEFVCGEQRAEATNKVKTQIQEWTMLAEDCGSDYEKIHLIHDLICQKVIYNNEYLNNNETDEESFSQSAYSVFCTDKAVCAGYAEAFQLMCNGLNIDTMCVTSSSHQWNKVRIDDSWYNIDVTWADDDVNQNIYYNYFARSDDYYNTVSDYSEAHHSIETFWIDVVPVCSLDSNPTSPYIQPGILPGVSNKTYAPIITATETTNGCKIEISTPAEDVTIYYTVDGTQPSSSYSKANIYNEPFMVGDATVIRAIAIADGALDSEIVEYSYIPKVKYTVMFEGNGAISGNMDPMTNCVYGIEYMLTENMFVKTGYTFIGWNTLADGTGITYQDGASIENLTSENGAIITLYAQWKKTRYNIEYELNGGENNSKNPTYYYATNTKVLYTPSRKGYTFKGWYSDLGCTKQVTKINKSDIGDKTLYAKWSINKYSVAFDGNEATSGSMNTMKNCKYTVGYVLTTNSFEKTGYTFIGWNTEADGSGKNYSNEANVKKLTDKHGETVTLYAQWKKTRYNIAYELNGGENNSKNPTYYYATNTKVLYMPSRKGYTFKGWYSDLGCTKQVTKINKSDIGDKTLYAKWSINKYNVAFDGNGATSGSMNTMKNCKYTVGYVLTTNSFEKTGYTFIGWNTEADGSGKNYSNEANVKKLTDKHSKTVTLYAQWKKTRYNIAYELNGGENNSKNPTYYYATNIKSLYTPSRKGYTFKGWYSDSNCTKQVTKINKSDIGDKTLYAKWSINKYNVAFDGNGATSGSMNTMKNCKYTIGYVLTTNSFEKTGYTFIGWNTEANGSGKNYSNEANVKKLTDENGKTVVLYAQWEKE